MGLHETRDHHDHDDEFENDRYFRNRKYHIGIYRSNYNFKCPLICPNTLYIYTYH